MPIRDWPAIDAMLWHEARKPMRFDRRARIAGHWSERRCRIVCQGYGQLLAFLDRNGQLDREMRPEDRITPELIERFVRQLQDRVAPWSVAMMVQGVQRMLAVLAPDDDWQWLNSVVANLKLVAKPTRDKRSHMVDARQLYELGLDLMGQARARSCDGEYHAATMGRDGLIIALLICTPVRIRNLQEIEIGEHLRASDRVYEVRFTAAETKTGRAFEGVLPEELTPWVDFYLRVHRPRLLDRGNNHGTRALWISRWGTPMIEHAVRDQIRIRTAAAFGRHVWPHLFRTIAATGVVDCAPEQAGLIPDLLGHASFHTSKRYYILSSAARAHSLVQSAVLDRREAALARLKAEADRKGTKP